MQVARILEPRQLGRDETGAQGRSHALWGEAASDGQGGPAGDVVAKQELLQIYAQYAPMGGIVEGVEAAHLFQQTSKYLSWGGGSPAGCAAPGAVPVPS